MDKSNISTDGRCISKVIEKIERKIGNRAAEQLKNTAVEIVQIRFFLHLVWLNSSFDVLAYI